MKNSVAALALSVECGSACANLTALVPWEGERKNTKGDRMLIYRSGKVMEVLVSDAFSFYRLVCIMTANDKAAQFVGDDISQADEQRYRFIYNNKMQLQNGAISKQWEATFDGGNTKGEVLFKPANAEKRKTCQASRLRDVHRFLLARLFTDLTFLNHLRLGTTLPFFYH